MNGYSVLMSVYEKENPANLKTAMESMFGQTVMPDEFVLVCDGPLNEGLDAVILEEKERYPEILRVVRLKENGGLGPALQAGLRICRNDLVARMDSDDISLPGRCEKQLAFMDAHPEVSILGGAIAEFQTDPEEIYAKRIVPEENPDIIAFSKKRNPFNHMTVMYRKDDILAVGGYQHFPFLEDYYLWVRMFLKGYQGHNLPDILVKARIGNGMMGRRSGTAYAATQKRLFSFMQKNGYITKVQYCKAVITRSAAAVMPVTAKELLYRKILRK